MAVIVSGIQMPKACIDCEYPNCDYYKAEWCRESDYTINYKNSVGVSCPLKPVVGKGGLIEKIEADFPGMNDNAGGDNEEKAMIQGYKNAIQIILEYCGEGKDDY